MAAPLVTEAPLELSTMPDDGIGGPMWLAWAIAIVGSTAAVLLPFAGLWLGMGR